jgi:hypothetical protein
MPTEARRVWDALRTRPVRDVVRALLQEPATPLQLAVWLDLPQSTARLYARRLRMLGVTDEKCGTLVLRAPELVSATLLSINPSRLDQLTDGAIGLFDALALDGRPSR